MIKNEFKIKYESIPPLKRKGYENKLGSKHKNVRNNCLFLLDNTSVLTVTW